MTYRPGNKAVAGITLLCTLLALVIAGMRVPDLAKPSRPKPRSRAVVEKQETSGKQSEERKYAKFLAVVPKAPTQPLLRQIRTTYVVVLSSVSGPIVAATSCRAPPAAAS